MVNIESQHAENIYNINGDLKLNLDPETLIEIKEEAQRELQKVYSISYLDIISNELAKKKILDRQSLFDALTLKLKDSGKLIIAGSPGVGKTTIIHKFVKYNILPIYISVKQISPLAVILYLINHINKDKGEQLFSTENIEYAKEYLQSSLQNTSLLFIIDDCEQNIELSKYLMNLNRFNSEFVYITRNDKVFNSCNIFSFQIPPFSKIEIKTFLSLHEIKLEVLKFNELCRKSGGTPLYLFYFCKYQVDPLPDDILTYQESIWCGLSQGKQDFLINIALPYFRIDINDLVGISSGSSSPLAISNMVEDLNGLVNNHNGEINLFHPLFREFIIDKITSIGLLDFYSRKLGQFYLDQSNYIQAIKILIDVAPDMVKEYILPSLRTINELGEITLSIKILNTRLNYPLTNFEKGYIYYHLSHSYHLSGDTKAADTHIDKAIEIFREEGDIFPINSSLMIKAMHLVEAGNINAGLKIAEEIISSTTTEDKFHRATLLVNISKIYIDTFQFDEAAKVCKEAYLLFEELDFVDGMISSLTNLVSSLGKIDEYLDEAEKYGLKLLDIVNENSNVMLEIFVLNSLTSIFRQKGQYEEAEIHGRKVVSICQQLGFKDKVILNLINLGNVIRDNGDTIQALNIYHEALGYAEEYNLEKDKGRLYWILASLNRGVDNDQSLIYADQSIFTNKKINFIYGIANAYSEKSETLLLMGRKIEAANELENSAEYYRRIKMYSTNYQELNLKALNIYLDEGSKEQIDSILSKLIQSEDECLDIDSMNDYICENDNKINVADYYYSYFEAKILKSQNISRLLILFMNYCKSLPAQEGRITFINTLKLFISNLGKAKYTYSNLAIAIEQSGSLISEDELESIITLLDKKIEFLSVRRMTEEIVFVTTVNNNLNLEFHVFNDEILCWKLVLSVILIMNEIADSSLMQIEIKEPVSIIYIHLCNEEYLKLFKQHQSLEVDIFDEDIQTLHMDKKGCDIDDFIIVNNEYEIYNALDFNNKCTMYFFVNIIARIKGHFGHVEVLNDDVMRKELIALIADILGCKFKQNKIDEDFLIDIEKL